eukprot:2354756-Amphidinium_carterae.1
MDQAKCHRCRGPTHLGILWHIPRHDAVRAEAGTRQDGSDIQARLCSYLGSRNALPFLTHRPRIASQAAHER